ncbi:MAG: hypothetical protein IT210_12340, partial [Armatimonadetes bacterium]|nr:hypothetical protein [Armatimonadota bacterium]
MIKRINRMHLSIIISLYSLVCLAAALDAAGSRGNKKQAHPKVRIVWSQPTIVDALETLDPKTIQTSSAPDGSALSIVFDDLTLRLEPNGDKSLAVRTVAVRIPMTVSIGRVKGFKTHIRGFVHKDADSRVAILADIGGKAQNIVFPYHKARNGNFFSEIRSGNLPKNAPYVLVMTFVIHRLN